MEETIVRMSVLMIRGITRHFKYKSEGHLRDITLSGIEKGDRFVQHQEKGVREKLAIGRTGLERGGRR